MVFESHRWSQWSVSFPATCQETKSCDKHIKHQLGFYYWNASSTTTCPQSNLSNYEDDWVPECDWIRSTVIGRRGRRVWKPFWRRLQAGCYSLRTLFEHTGTGTEMRPENMILWIQRTEAQSIFNIHVQQRYVMNGNQTPWPPRLTCVNNKAGIHRASAVIEAFACIKEGRQVVQTSCTEMTQQHTHGTEMSRRGNVKLHTHTSSVIKLSDWIFCCLKHQCHSKPTGGDITLERQKKVKATGWNYSRLTGKNDPPQSSSREKTLFLTGATTVIWSTSILVSVRQSKDLCMH